MTECTRDRLAFPAVTCRQVEADFQMATSPVMGVAVPAGTVININSKMVEEALCLKFPLHTPHSDLMTRIYLPVANQAHKTNGRMKYPDQGTSD